MMCQNPAELWPCFPSFRVEFSFRWTLPRKGFAVDSPDLAPFRNSDGSTSQTGSTLAGQHEAKQGWAHAPQQSYESSEAYIQRINSGNGSSGS